MFFGEGIEWMSELVYELVVWLVEVCEVVRLKIVFVESCIGGLIVVILVFIFGVLEWFCGFVVMYCEVMKFEWFDVKLELLILYFVVSFEVSVEMVKNVFV